MILPIILITVGLIALVVSGNYLVKGASSIAKHFGISPIVIGLTVVAFGTSAPELIVNILAAVKGTPDIAIGNIIGSNIANILLILGIASIITPLVVKRGTTWKEIPMALLAAILVFVMGNDILIDGKNFAELTKSDGIALIAFFAIFIYYTFGISKSDGKAEKVTEYPIAKSVGFTLLGIIGLFIGGKLLVDNAVILARLAGWSELLIGATIVAIGTSLPELITSIIAATKKQSDIAIGNVIGSNIFNVFWILGLTSIITPLPFNQKMVFDISVNIFATILLFAFMFIGEKHKLTRWQGILFVLLYIGYVGAIITRG